jgi:hypothetical protein
MVNLIASPKAPVGAEAIFKELVDIMSADNCFHFKFTEQQKARALPHVVALKAAGYFVDDPNDLDGSFWQMAAGEFTEAAEFFNRLPAYDALGGILNEIFNGA